MDNSQARAAQQPAVEGPHNPPSPPPKDHGARNPPPAAPRLDGHHHDSQSRLLRTQAELEGSKRACGDLQSRLLKAQEELEHEKRAHGETASSLRTKEQEYQNVRLTWKNLLSEFNRFQAQSQTFASLDDDVLRQKVSQLRYNVRNVALQHFDTGRLPGPKKREETWEQTYRFLDIEASKFEAFMKTPRTRIMLVQSILWAYITKAIFCRFRWADDSIRSGLDAIQDKFDRHSNRGSSVTSEEIRVQQRFNMWKANTTSLLMEATPLEKSRAGKISEHVATDTGERICRRLSPFSASSERKLFDEVYQVMMEAIDLDLLIHGQAAAIDWLFEDETGRKFNPETMEMVGEPGAVVRLVVASGVVKRGKSNGQDFETASCLLKAQVVCEAVNVPAPPARDRDRKGTGVESFRYFFGVK